MMDDVQNIIEHRLPKELLYVCVKNPFCQRDLERMGIEALEQIFEVQILDCTEWLMPKAYSTRGVSPFLRKNLYQIKSLGEFHRFIRHRSGGFAIDHIGQFSIQALLLFHALKRNGTQIVIVDSGAYPAPVTVLGKSSLLSKAIEALRHGVFMQMAKEKCVKWLLKLLPDQRPDIAFVAGEAWKEDHRFCSARYHIHAHSFDYEIFRTMSVTAGSTVVPYAVYLDEKIANHEDNAELGLPDPANSNDFYPALRRFFEAFEVSTGIPIAVAAYPSLDMEKSRLLFGERRICRGRTAELVRDASVVFAHASTAISFAVLWRKPIVFLTNHDVSSSWYQPWIDAPRLMLGARLFNIDEDFPSCRVEDWLEFDAAAFDRYEQRFIKSSHAPDISLWDQFSTLLQRRFCVSALVNPNQ